MFIVIKVCVAVVVAGLLVWGGVWVFADVSCSKTEEVQSRLSCWVADAKTIAEDEFDDVNEPLGIASTAPPA